MALLGMCSHVWLNGGRNVSNVELILVTRLPLTCELVHDVVFFVFMIIVEISRFSVACFIIDKEFDMNIWNGTFDIVMNNM